MNTVFDVAARERGRRVAARFGQMNRALWRRG